MSRVANQPIQLPKGVDVTINKQHVQIKGSKGTLEHTLHHTVGVEQNDDILTVVSKEKSKNGSAQSGTARALLHNMVHGVSQGFERKLTLVGVGYRAKVQGSTVNLTLGFSHPVDHQLPEGVTAETPSVTEIVLKGIDKQKVGQVAADIRAYRPPEPYKGKGVRYADEQISLKEAKKK